MSLVVKQRKHVIEADLVDVLKCCHGYWHVQISSKKDLCHKLQHKVTFSVKFIDFL